MKASDGLAPLRGTGLQLSSASHQHSREPVSTAGKVISVNGPVVIGSLPRAAVGDQCIIELRNGREMPAQVVGFESHRVQIAPYDCVKGLSSGCIIRSDFGPPQLEVNDQIKGCVIDCLGRVQWRVRKDKKDRSTPVKRSLEQSPPTPMSRRRISEVFQTGIRSIDGLCTLGIGQRIGLFAPPGVGKSTLLSMIAKNALFDTCVIGLVGERGREVREFVEDALGPEAMERSVVVLSTSDESPMRRKRAAFTATSIAEHYRDKGHNVLLLLDSLTRMARASREVGLAAGELPVRKGYTSSVFTELPQLLERAGMSDRGAITAIYTVLTEDADIDDPLAEEVKSIVDGHLVLSRSLAAKGIYPAIDPLQSVSRLMTQVRSTESMEAAGNIRRIVSRLERDKDLMLFGGTPDRELEACLRLEKKLFAALHQGPNENSSLEETDLLFQSIAQIFKTANEQAE